MTRPAAALVTHRGSGRSAVLALARIEGGRVLRNRLFLLAAAVTAWLILDAAKGHEINGWTDAFFFVQVTWFPLYVATFVVMHTVALRQTPAQIVEAFAPLPTPIPAQARSILLAGAAPVSVAVLLAAAQWLLIRRAGGLVVGHAMHRMPWTLIEAAQIPVLTALAMVAGVALGTVPGSRPVGLLMATLVGYSLVALGWVVNLFPSNLISPLSYPFKATDLGSTLDRDEYLAWPILLPPDNYDPHWYGVSHAPWASAAQNLYILTITVILTGCIIRRARRAVAKSFPFYRYFVPGAAVLVQRGGPEMVGPGNSGQRVVSR